MTVPILTRTKLTFAAEAPIAIGDTPMPVSAKANWTEVVTNSGSIASSGGLDPTTSNESAGSIRRRSRGRSGFSATRLAVESPPHPGVRAGPSARPQRPDNLYIGA